MNLRALCEQDLGLTLEDCENGFAREFSLTDTAGNVYGLSGVIGDIGVLFDAEGNQVSGRSVVASYRLSALVGKGGKFLQPGRGWKACVTDFDGTQVTLYVTDFRPDRSLGIGVLYLSLEFGL